MRSRATTVSFVLFVIVLLGTLFWLLHQQAKTNWGLVTVLVGVLVLRGGLFFVNLRQQRRNTEKGRGPVQIETRLGLNDDPPEDSGPPQVPPSPAPPSDETRRP